MFSPPPGNLKPAYLATRKLDESLLSDSRMADGVEVTVVPRLAHSDKGHWVHMSSSHRGLFMVSPF